MQQGEYTTVGGRVPIKTNVRIIAATNKDLRISIGTGAFRRTSSSGSTWCRYACLRFRERTEDLPDLFRHFVALVEKEGLPESRSTMRRWTG